MKKIHLLISSLLVLSIVLLTSFSNSKESVYQKNGGGEKAKADTTEASMAFTVRTESDGIAYSPRHVLSIWIKDNAGNFVKSLKVRANNRKKHLVKWVASSNYNEVDAITGATLNSHTTHTVIWNCKDVNGSTVPDDDYQIWVEYTSENSDSNGNPGPSYSVTVTKGDSTYIFSPPTQQYFKSMVVEYQPTGVSIFENEENSVTQMQVFPNPITEQAVISFNLKENMNGSLLVFDANGKLIKEIIKEQMINAGESEIIWNVSDDRGNKLPSGIYNIILSSGSGKASQKVIISK